MATDRLRLTRDPLELCRILRAHAEKETANMAVRRCIWLLAYYYLQGYRRFSVFDPVAGNVVAHYLGSENGTDKDATKLSYQSQELLVALDRVTSQLASGDLRPRILRGGNSLRAFRDRAVTQVIDDALFSDDQIEKEKTKFLHLFATLGSCGIQGHIEDHPVVGLSADIEVIHPMELMPFPSLTLDYTKQRGLVRQRYVPLEFLVDKFGRRIKSNVESLEYYEVQAGSPLDVTGGISSTIGGVKYISERTGNALTNSKSMMEVVKVRELWLDGHRDTCSRYVVCSGDYMIEDLDLSRDEAYCPIGFARFMENGTFHGVGLFDVLFSISRKLEKLLQSLFVNVESSDKYGVIVMPQGAWNERAALRDVGHGLRVLPYMPDPGAESFRPFAIQPYNSGDFPGKVAQMTKQLMDGMSPWQDLLREKGRVDSQVGLAFLDEKIRQAMTSPTRGVQQAFGSMYRGATNEAIGKMILSPRAIPVTHLTLDLAGAVIDPDENTVSFTQSPEGRNSIPDISRLTFTVRDVNPSSAYARKEEMFRLAEMRTKMEGRGDWTAFVITSITEGIDITYYTDEEKAAVETVILNILTLYGDGEEPAGPVILTPHVARPDIQIRILQAFMSGPYMRKASVFVQNDFATYLDTLKGYMGMILPEGIPNPDDQALAAQAQMQMQAQPALQ